MQLRASLLLAALLGSAVPWFPLRATASAPAVVISEVAWAGSSDSANDEWIELQNTSGATVDLTGWTILDDGSTTYALSGTIPARGFFLLERSEAATSVASDLLLSNLSLANTGDALVLRDAALATIDTANAAGGMWPAGAGTGSVSMERTNPLLADTAPGAWASSTATGPATASAGTAIRGTPRATNSTAAPSGTIVALDLPAAPVAPGATITIPLVITDGFDVLSYGLDLEYNPLLIEEITANEGTFLAGAPAVATAFQAALVDDTPGRFRLAGARTTTPASTVSGNGTLATLQLTLAPGASGSVALSLGADAFLAGASEELDAAFAGGSFDVAPSIGPVTNLVITPGTARYSLTLAWTEPDGGADQYRVYRRDAGGSFIELGTTTEATYVDSDAVAEGGAIIPTRSYMYRVLAERGSDVSAATDASGADPRGLLGDNTRDDQTDGRDLTVLARSWGLATGDDGFAVLADTTVDGSVDDGDLVDLALHWAQTYTP